MITTPEQREALEQLCLDWEKLALHYATLPESGRISDALYSGKGSAYTLCARELRRTLLACRAAAILGIGKE